jgi:hypothetical protein
MHLSVTSSDMGKHELYWQYCTLLGGTAMSSLNQWASRVFSSHMDPKGQGSYASTTFQGKNDKTLSIMCAYIAAQNRSPKGRQCTPVLFACIMQAFLDMLKTSVKKASEFLFFKSPKKGNLNSLGAGFFFVWDISHLRVFKNLLHPPPPR